MAKKFDSKKILYIGIGLTVLLVVVLMLDLMKRSKAKKQCILEGGVWDKKTKTCASEIIEEDGTVIRPDGYTPPPHIVESDPTIIWTPNALASEIAQKIEGYNFQTYPEVAEKILALNDDQLKSLYKYYNNYKAKDYPTLTKLFANEWSDWGGKYGMVVTRLESLNLM